MAVNKYDSIDMDAYTSVAIELFEQVRDRPLVFPEHPGDKNANTCIEKSMELNGIYNEAEIESRIRACEYLWKDQKIPARIKKIPHQDDGVHFFLNVYVPIYGWLVADAMNDPGIMIYNEWDGKTDCQILNNYTKILGPEESLEALQKSLDNMDERVKQNSEFFKAMNLHFGEFRERYLARMRKKIVN